MTRSKKDQRSNSNVSYALEIFKKGEIYWESLIKKVIEQRTLNQHDIEFLEVAKKSTKTGKLVSDKQAAVIKEIVEKLKEIGIE